MEQIGSFSGTQSDLGAWFREGAIDFGQSAAAFKRAKWLAELAAAIDAADGAARRLVAQGRHIAEAQELLKQLHAASARSKTCDWEAGAPRFERLVRNGCVWVTIRPLNAHGEVSAS